jgi:adenylate cyclase
MTEMARIMVVDDEQDVEVLVTQKFRREIRSGKMSFVFARDGQEALDKLALDPDVMMVLSDINMPGMDGLTLLGQLEEQQSDLKTVIISAYGDLQNIRTAMNRGAFDFLTKPIDFADLETTIQKTLKHLECYRELNRQKTVAEAARAVLAKYFSPNVVETLAADGGMSVLGGERREATFLFTDLTGFTKLVEATESDIIVELLNGYLDGVAQIIFRHDGTVMKVIGDAVQAIFGAPVAQSDHCARAVACALDIDDFTRQHQQDWIDKGIALGVTRIGLNAGEAIIGNFGGDSFFDYTAYGDAVNIAARLETANKKLGTRVCVSESVVENIEGFLGRPAGRLMLAGKGKPQMAYEPLRKEAAASDATARYCEAYDLLVRGDESARAAFAGLLAVAPNDPLVALHLQRVLAGAIDDVIDGCDK